MLLVLMVTLYFNNLHSIIGVFAVHRMRIRDTKDNPDSLFAAMPQTITPTGMELNPSTEPIEEPKKEEIKNENSL